jgi:hypothetical protein
LGFFDKRTAEEKALDEANKIADNIAKRRAKSICPLILDYESTSKFTNEGPSLSEFQCLGLDCRWWSQSGNECYILLTCKKILGET